MKQDSASAFKPRLEQRHPYLFVEYWKEGERTFNWFAEWEHLSLKISDVRVSISYQYVARKFGDDPPSVPLGQFDEKSVPSNIPGDQKKAYLEYVSRLFNETFTKADSARAPVISGTFTTEDRRSIGFIRSGEAEKPGGIRKGHIALYSSTEVRRGYLWSVDEDEAKWSPSQKPGEVCINLYLAPAQIEEAIAEIKQAALANRQIRVAADIQVLTFQSEVDRSLAEPYHSQTYYFQEGAFAPAVLERLTIVPVSSQTTAPADDDDADNIPAPAILVAPPAAGSQSAPRQPRYSTKALVIALWAIAIAIIIHALR